MVNVINNRSIKLFLKKHTNPFANNDEKVRMDAWGKPYITNKKAPMWK